MIIRELAPEEYGRLAGHPRGHPVPDPATSRIVIAEEDGQIVAFWPLTQIVVCDGVWVDPAYRGTLLPARLWAGIRQILDATRVEVLHSFAASPEVAGYLERLGFTLLPYAVFSCQLPLSPQVSPPALDSSATSSAPDRADRRSLSSPPSSER